MASHRSVDVHPGSSSAEFSRIQCLVQDRGVCVLMLAYRHNWLSRPRDLEGHLPSLDRTFCSVTPLVAPPTMKVEQRGRVKSLMARSQARWPSITG